MLVIDMLLSHAEGFPSEWVGHVGLGTATPGHCGSSQCSLGLGQSPSWAGRFLGEMGWGSHRGQAQWRECWQRWMGS